MLKLPIISKYLNDNPDFYNHQVQEELNFMDTSEFVFDFMDLGKLRRGIFIKFRDSNKLPILVVLPKYNYKKINEILVLIRLNMALKVESIIRTSKNLDEETLDISSTSKDRVHLNKEKEIIISDGKDLTLNGEKMILDRKVLEEKLLEFARVKTDLGEYLDFFNSRLDPGIQNYLLLSLYQSNIDLDDKLSNALTHYKLKDSRFYYLINSFMRGNFEEMLNYLNELDKKINIGIIPLLCQNLIQSCEELPTRKYDIVIYRAGNGKTKNLNIGAENENLGFSSFGTKGGVISEPLEDGEQSVMYRRILRKDEKAIPVDLIENLGVFYQDGTEETEVITMPYKFKVCKKTRIDDLDLDLYDIEKTQDIDPRELLGKRFLELEEYLKLKNETVRLNELISVKKVALKRRPKEISKINMKDIYFGLRPENKERDF